MNTVSFTNIADGIEGCYIKTTRFKTTRISINLLLPLKKESVTSTAILPFLLTRCSDDYPDFTALSKKLDELYGAAVYGDVTKYGDMHVIKLAIGYIDNKFAYGENISKQCSDLILSMLFSPALDNNGLFVKDAFESEKRQLIERIDGEINDKRRYALLKSTSAICKDEPYCIPKYGFKKDAEMLTNKAVIDTWNEVLKTAYIRINVVGSDGADEIFKNISERFSRINRAPLTTDITTISSAKSTPLRIEERMDVAQGKLVLGFRVPKAKDIKDSVVMRVMSDILGGGPYSLLFENVREKQSLCYYCAARYDMHKGIIMVDSGVEEENAEKAEFEILKQLDAIKSGDFSDDTFSASILALNDSAKTLSDLPSSLDGWYSNQIFDNKALSLEEYSEIIKSVTKDEVINACRSVLLDTVYFLHGLK